MGRADDRTVRVVWGTGTGPTRTAAYDAALAEAGVHNYNLETVSSILPAHGVVKAVGTAPDLGPAGHRLTVVQARVTARIPGHVSACLGWTTGEGPGVFYEVAGEFDEDEARERVETGLAAARGLRKWRFDKQGVRATGQSVESGDGYVSAVALAVYGRGERVI